jgi:tetratricopeptide (TPR) repeat protein
MTPSLIAPAFLTGILLMTFLVAGTYVLYLRNLGHLPPMHRLRRKGLDSLIAGQPVAAENHFRASLAMAVDVSDRVRGLVCLGDALMDQGRYEESKACLLSALELGDPTGSGQGSMSDLLLITRADPERALEMAEEAMEKSTRASINVYFGRNVTNDLRLAKYWARRGNGLAQLDRSTEARQAIDRALRVAEAAESESQQSGTQASILATIVLGRRRIAHGRDLALATTHWRIGLALLAIGDSSKATDHFRITRDTDRRGKYRRLAQQQLELLEPRQQ